MDTDALFEPSSNPDSIARWSPLTDDVLVTASGAPGKKRFARVARARLLTASELTRHTQRSGRLVDRVEPLLT